MKIKKLANALYPDAEPIEQFTGALKRSVNLQKKIHERLWVGGKINIDDDSISFHPNEMNIALHKELSDVVLPRKQIIDIKYEFGWFSGIVVVHHYSGTFKFRCHGAKSLVKQLNE